MARAERAPPLRAARRRRPHPPALRHPPADGRRRRGLPAGAAPRRAHRRPEDPARSQGRRQRVGDTRVRVTCASSRVAGCVPLDGASHCELYLNHNKILIVFNQHV